MFIHRKSQLHKKKLSSQTLALHAASQKGSVNMKVAIMAFINTPFTKLVEQMLKTLRNSDPSSDETAVINDSVRDKYVPALRNATLLSLLAAPAYIQNAQVAYVIFGIISSLTGLAWFSMSLKDVKAKFTKFGIELTADMLEAFLTSIFLIALLTGYGVISEPIQKIFLINHQTAINNSGAVQGSTLIALFDIIKVIVPLSIMFKIMSSLVSATIKHDANDAMLTGSTDAAQVFF